MLEMCALITSQTSVLDNVDGAKQYTALICYFCNFSVFNYTETQFTVKLSH